MLGRPWPPPAGPQAGSRRRRRRRRRPDPILKSALISMFPRDRPLPRAFRAGAAGRLRRHRDADRCRARTKRTRSPGSPQRRAGSEDPFRDEYGPLEAAALDQRSGDRLRRASPGWKTSLQQRRAVGRPTPCCSSPPSSTAHDVGPRRLDALAAGDPRAPSSRWRAKLKVVVAIEEVWNKFLLSPIQFGALRRRIRVAVGARVLRRRKRGVLSAFRRTGSGRWGRGS